MKKTKVSSKGCTNSMSNSGEKDRIKGYIQDLEKLYRAENYQKAYEIISRIERKEPILDIEYLEIKYKILLATNRLDEALIEVKKVLEYEQNKDKKHILKTILGEIYFWKGKYVKALRCLQSSLLYFSKRNYEISGHIYYLIGCISFQRNNFEVADVYYDKAIQCYLKLQSYKHLGLIYLVKGILSYKSGNYNASIKRLLIASRLYRASRNKPKSLWVLRLRLTLGRALLMKGDLDRAERFLTWSIGETKRLGYNRFEALANEFLGELKYLRGQYDEALKYLLHAKRTAFKTAPGGDIAVEVLRRLGEVYLALGKQSKSENVLNQALEISESLEDRYERGAILRTLAVLHSRRGETEVAQAYFNESILTLKLIKDRLELARTYEASAVENLKWSKDAKEKENKRRIYISTARDHCLEAVHLYSSLGINGNVSRAKKLLKKIDERAESFASVGKRIRLPFRNNWLFARRIVARSPGMRQVIVKAENSRPYNGGDRNRERARSEIHSRIKRQKRFFRCRQLCFDT